MRPISTPTAIVIALGAGVVWRPCTAATLQTAAPEPAAAVAPATPASKLSGFPGTAAAADERALEARFDASLHRENLRDWMQRISARPHHIGSPYDEQNSQFIAGLFRSWGYDTQIETFQVLFPTPKLRKLELIAPQHFTATLREPALAEDATSGQSKEQLPTYNAYSIDGDVTGDLVYVNFGVPERLRRARPARHRRASGKIVIARYGGSWRGIKPKVAAEHGAVGCIIYSDPHDDGYFQGDVYPKGG